VRKNFFHWVEYVLLFFLLVHFFFSGIKTVAFQPDESHWISSSEVFEAYFSGKFSSPLWDISYMTVTQPPLPRYIIGLGRWMGGFRQADLNLPWEFDKDSLTNVAAGRKPSFELLWWSRLPMVILAATSIFIGFWLLKKNTGRLTGYIWILLSLLSVYYPLTLIRAMGDSALLFFIAITLIISNLLLQCSDNQITNKVSKLYIYFLFLGIAIGLAESSKLNGLSAIVAGFGFAVLIAFRMKQTQTMKIRFVLVSILILVFASQITFVGMNPFLWKNPMVRTITMFNQRLIEMNVQTHVFPSSRIQGFGQHVSVLTNRIFESHSSLHFDGALWINITFFLIGFIYLVVQAVKYCRNQNSNPEAVVILAIGLATSLPSLFTPLDWDRYYIFPIYFSTMAITIGIWLTAFFGIQMIRNKITLTRME